MFAGSATFALLYCVQPLLPVLARDFSVGAAASSLALSFATALLALAIAAAAMAAESLGRRSLMFCSLALAALLNMAVTAAHSWPTLLLLRAAEGCALGGVPAVAMTYLAEEMDPRGLGVAMGLYIAGTAFGGMAGRVGAGLLTQLLSWRAALLLLGAMGLAAALAFIALAPPSRQFTRARQLDAYHHLRAWAGHLQRQPLRRLFAVGFLVMGAFVTIYNYVGFRLMAPPYSFNQRELGLIFVIYLFGIAASWMAGALADRIGPRRVLTAGIAIAALGVGLSLLHPLPLLLAGVVVVTIGFFTAHAVASGWVGALAAGSKGHASALYLLAYYLGSSIAGTVGGWFWAAGGWPAVAAFTLVLLALALVACLGVKRS
jgi:YNFM family putative membrane transporter